MRRPTVGLVQFTRRPQHASGRGACRARSFSSTLTDKMNKLRARCAPSLLCTFNGTRDGTFAKIWADPFKPALHEFAGLGTVDVLVDVTRHVCSSHVAREVWCWLDLACLECGRSEIRVKKWRC